jgi:hypothetical protein
MNLYLLLALAFGAMTADAPAARAPLAGVVLRGEAAVVCGRPARTGRASRPTAIVAGRGARRVRARRPHTNPSSPRAPAIV